METSWGPLLSGEPAINGSYPYSYFSYFHIFINPSSDPVTGIGIPG
jgi:hypothetical protein